MMPDAFPIFFRGRSPRPAQSLVMPPVVRGKSALLAAPTASGKTEAAVTPLFQRHVSFRRRRLSTLYIAPTKALANDIFERLDTYLGIRSPGCIARYTGDRHEFDAADGLFCLVVTPEALDSLQLTRPAALTGVRAVIVDEIHLLHGVPRGQQLRFVMDRLRAAADAPSHPQDTFQVVGMTATIDQLEEVRDLWLGPSGTLVRHGAPREIELTLIDANDTALPSDDRAGRHARALARWLKSAETPKVLIFENSRNGAHALAAALHDELQAAYGERAPQVHLHMGVLSVAERERVERSMKADRSGICVATSTLEIGIDIGDVDAVVLAAPLAPSAVTFSGSAAETAEAIPAASSLFMMEHMRQRCTVRCWTARSGASWMMSMNTTDPAFASSRCSVSHGSRPAPRTVSNPADLRGAPEATPMIPWLRTCWPRVH